MAFGRLLRRRGKHSASRNGASDAEKRPRIDDLTESVDTDSAPDDGEFAESQPAGPYDAATDDYDDAERLDLGSLLVPKLSGTEVRLESEGENKPITGVLVVDGRSGVHMVACAAPRTEGLWDDVRSTLRDNLAKNSSDVREESGEFGPEIWAAMSTAQGPRQVRFAGVDGPRWMLRVVFSGAAGEDPTLSDTLLRVVRNTVVVRDDSPRPVREPLPLRLPKQDDAKTDDNASAETPQEDNSDAPAKYAPPQRGVETTEIR